MTNEKHLKASHRLEELNIALKEIIIQLRNGVSPGLAYALVYHLRREIGYVVGPLGVGIPQADYAKFAKEIIDAQIPPN